MPELILDDSLVLQPSPLMQWDEAIVTIRVDETLNLLLPWAGRNRWMNVRLFDHGVVVEDLEGDKYFPLHAVMAIEDPYDEPTAIEKLESALAEIEVEQPELPFEETLDDVRDLT